MSEHARTRNVRGVNRVTARAAKQSWGSFATSVLGGHVYIIISKTKDAPKGGAHAAAVPARWVPDAPDLETTTTTSYQCKYKLGDIVVEVNDSEDTTPRAVIATDHGKPTIAIIPLTTLAAWENRTVDSLLDAEKLSVVDPAATH